MRFPLLALSFSLFIVPFSKAAEPAELSDLNAKYEAAVARVKEPLREHKEAYVKQLAELKNEVQRLGDLTGVLAIEREILSAGHRLEKIDESHASLQRVCEDYQSRRATLLGNLRPSFERLENVYVDQLTNLQAELTKAGRFEDALYVKEFVGLVQRDREPDSTELINHWEFDGNAQDAGSAKFHGRDYGTNYVNGRIGSGSAKFGQGSYILVTNRSELDLLYPFTISAWIHPEYGVRRDTVAPIVSKGADSWQLQHTESDSVRFSLKAETGGLSVKSRPDSVRGGKWHHVIVTFNGKDLFLYLDGVRVDEDGKHDYELNHSSESDLMIGSVPESSDAAFQGAVDDLRIYKRVLKPMEIAALARL